MKEKKKIEITREEFKKLVNELIEAKKKFKELNEKYTHATIKDDE